MTRSDRLKGTRLGAYEIVRALGHGATATVFEAKHVALDKPVALKLLHDHLAGDAAVRATFLREGRVAARMHHPNIVDVIDVGADGDTPYLVMDLLRGTDLRAHLDASGALPPAEALALLLPIASALAHAHELGVVHRDLKPSNVFLAHDARGDLVPTLLDFGLAKAAELEPGGLQTQTSRVAGTALYMSPEQTLGVGHATAASDQYSLAALLYEALTGAPPFEADGLPALLDRIRTGTAPPPSTRSARVPAALDRVVLRALQRDPASRYPDVAAFGAALLAFADDGTRRSTERDFTPASGRSAAAVLPSRAGSRPSAPQRRATPVHETLEPLPCPPGASPFHIKGLAYRGFVHMVARVAPGGMDAFCEKLDDPRLPPFLRQPFLAGARYDVLPFVPLFATLAGVLGRDFTDVVTWATRGQARYDARTVYRAIFASERVEDIALRLNRFCGQYYDFGRYAGSVPQPGRLVLLYEEIPEYVAAWYAPMHVAYAVESARIIGATGMRLVQQSTTPAGRRGDHPLVTIRTELAWDEVSAETIDER